MLDFLITLDKQWLLYLNSMHTPYFDAFFYIFTQTATWIPFYVLLAFAFLKHQGPKGLISIIFIVLVITLCDQIASTFFKDFFERFRPTHEPVIKDMVHTVMGKRGKAFGFISSHAANTFGLALFTSLVFRNRLFTTSVISWALINSYSRIYLGVHYPGDIIVGALVGIIVGVLLYKLYLIVIPRFLVLQHHNKRILKKSLSESFGKVTPGVLALSMTILIAAVFISAKIVYKYI